MMLRGPIFAEKLPVSMNRQPLRPVQSVFNISPGEDYMKQGNTDHDPETYLQIQTELAHKTEYLQIQTELAHTTECLKRQKDLTSEKEGELRREKAQREEFEHRCKLLASKLDEETKRGIMKCEKHEKELTLIKEGCIFEIDQEKAKTASLQKALDIAKAATASHDSGLQARVVELELSLAQARHELQKVTESLEFERADAKVKETDNQYLKRELEQEAENTREVLGKLQSQVTDLKAEKATLGSLTADLEQQLKQERRVGTLNAQTVENAIPQALKETCLENARLHMDVARLERDVEELRMQLESQIPVPLTTPSKSRSGQAAALNAELVES